MERFGRVTARHKGPGDLVTEADFAAQETVRRTLHDAFPCHVLIGEEDPVPGHNSHSGNEFRWIVDPLDGTTNYVHRVPFFSVSLALEHAGQLLTGAVFNPMSDECFTAVAGQGAALNGTPIHTGAVRALPDALIAAGFPAAVSPDSPDLKVFNQVVLKSQGVRRTGSAALNLAYVAAGRFDAGWSCSTKIWDTAAGSLLIREAGGMATSLMGDASPHLSGPFLVAGTRELHQEMLALIRRTI
jgi:myo-inositol-1(or 4)-monophosphatase